ncbi:TPA: hypothetical protein N0F65_000394 [Lagenidium giganteum]|uniref:RNA helicase n=1 Tax=Lagenidium giganteum TaxID=4803 RepID=A0AAV2YYH5_9STRA|nr:TPA: hypothetical protein N0F65_000394 [Lagenidium giganteum]
MDVQQRYLRNARRKARQNRSYFDEGDGGAAGASNVVEDDNVDPLDAFMQDIESQVAAAPTKHAPSKVSAMNATTMDADNAELWSMQVATNGGGASYVDSDEEVYATAKQLDRDALDPSAPRKEIESLAPLDHAAITYDPFRKEFYTPHPDVAKMDAAQVQELRRELGVRVQGNDVPHPVRSFMQVGLDRKMLALLMKLGLEAPTPIQAQAFPVAMSGRDMIGIAKTGSGKTLAFTLPMVWHVMDQRELAKGEGPIAIVLSPTRELAHQIFGQAKKFLAIYGAECAAIYGGVGKWEQIQAVRKGVEVVVATPGRLIEMIRKKTTKMTRVTFVVLDEADRMFEMGFEPQLRSILGQIRPDRQTLLFSATFRRRIEALALDVLHNPVRVTVGQIGQANEDIRQIAVVLANDMMKWKWLMEHLASITAEGRVLIFAGNKAGCEEMTKNLNAMKFPSVCLHGDKQQHERSEALSKFKSGQVSILVATDVASRGLDIKDIKTVINYDVARSIDTHVHRIGRTGRMGAEGFEPGTAYTLVTNKESPFAAQLVYNMDVSGQTVPAELLMLAKKDPRFRRGTRAAAPVSTEDEQLHAHQAAREEARLEEMEDRQEMERWTQSRTTRKQDQRKGLGFAGPAPSTRGGMTGFVRGSANALANSFQSAFVKASKPDLAHANPPTAPSPSRPTQLHPPPAPPVLGPQPAATPMPPAPAVALPPPPPAAAPSFFAPNEQPAPTIPPPVLVAPATFQALEPTKDHSNSTIQEHHRRSRSYSHNSSRRSRSRSTSRSRSRSRGRSRSYRRHGSRRSRRSLSHSRSRSRSQGRRSRRDRESRGRSRSCSRRHKNRRRSSSSSRSRSRSRSSSGRYQGRR